MSTGSLPRVGGNEVEYLDLRHPSLILVHVRIEFSRSGTSTSKRGLLVLMQRMVAALSRSINVSSCCNSCLPVRQAQVKLRLNYTSTNLRANKSHLYFSLRSNLCQPCQCGLTDIPTPSPCRFGCQWPCRDSSYRRQNPAW